MEVSSWGNQRTKWLILQQATFDCRRVPSGNLIWGRGRVLRISWENDGWNKSSIFYDSDFGPFRLHRTMMGDFGVGLSMSTVDLCTVFILRIQFQPSPRQNQFLILDKRLPFKSVGSHHLWYCDHVKERRGCPGVKLAIDIGWQPCHNMPQTRR